jgi:hypothetical protein
MLITDLQVNLMTLMTLSHPCVFSFKRERSQEGDCFLNITVPTRHRPAFSPFQSQIYSRSLARVKPRRRDGYILPIDGVPRYLWSHSNNGGFGSLAVFSRENFYPAPEPTQKRKDLVDDERYRVLSRQVLWDLWSLGTFGSCQSVDFISGLLLKISFNLNGVLVHTAMLREFISARRIQPQTFTHLTTSLQAVQKKGKN